MNDARFNSPIACRAALLTSRGRSAIATIAIEGSTAAELVDANFRTSQGRLLSEIPRRRIAFGYWSNAVGAAEGVVGVRLEESVEIHCHGGDQAAKSILRDLAMAGASISDSWFSSSGITRDDRLPSTIVQEAAYALTQAVTEPAALVLLEQFHGALDRTIVRIEEHVASAEWQAAEMELDALLASWQWGRHLIEPWNVVLFGPPNVGKSSLINAIVGYERAIVFDQPGTTRDVVVADTAIEGWPVRLADTAGLREATCELESEGIARGRSEIERADCVLIVIDHAVSAVERSTIRESMPPRDCSVLTVLNKIDLDLPRDEPHVDHFVSAKTGEGIARLLKSIIDQFGIAATPTSSVLFTQRQADAAKRLQQKLVDRDATGFQTESAKLRGVGVGVGRI